MPLGKPVKAVLVGSSVGILALCLLVISGAPVGAHGGGTVQAEEVIGPYRVVIETNETPNAGFFGGTVHVTVIITPAGEPTRRLRNLRVDVTGVGPGGARVGAVRAESALNGAYEADLTVRDPGPWVFRVHLSPSEPVNGNSEGTDGGAVAMGKEHGEGLAVFEIAFPLDVMARPWWGDLGLVGALFLIPVLALSGMVHRARHTR